MVVVQLTNGFGNNLFQFIAARQLAEHHKKDLFLMTNANYYAIKDLKKLGISGFITHRPPKKFKMVNDNNYLDFFLKTIFITVQKLMKLKSGFRK